MKSPKLPLLALLILLTSLAGIRPANAQWAVIDGANLQQNVMKYAMAAEAHLTQMNQWETDIARQEMMYEQTIGNTFAQANNMADSVTAPYYMLNDQASADLNELGVIEGGPDGAKATVQGGLDISRYTADNLKASQDQFRLALQEAEDGGKSQTAQMQAANQMAAVEAMIQNAQAQDIAAMLDEQQAREEAQQQFIENAEKMGLTTQYQTVQPSAQSTDSGESICIGQVQDQYCQTPSDW